MTRAATPAVSGADSLVPPPSMTGVGWPAKLVQSAYSAVFGGAQRPVQLARGDEPKDRPVWVKPLELNELMLLFRSR